MWGSSLFTPEDFKDLIERWSLKERRAFFSNLTLEERLMGIKPEERLTGLSAEEIEDYLKTIKKK